MSIVLKPLFDVLTGNVAVMNNVLFNYLILIIIGEIAYRVAWNFVRNLYQLEVIDGKASGSIIHWIIRLIAYVICAYLIRGGIWLYNIVILFPHWMGWLRLGIIAAFLIFVIVIIFIRMKSAYD